MFWGENVKKIQGVLIIVLLFYFELSFAQELFMLKNVFIKEPIDGSQIKMLHGAQLYHFKPGNRIVAVFCFNPPNDGDLEFRWGAPLKKIQPKSYFHHVKQKIPKATYTAYAWIILDDSLIGRILGSNFEGPWQLEVYFDKKKIASKSFYVSS